MRLDVLHSIAATALRLHGGKALLSAPHGAISMWAGSCPYLTGHRLRVWPAGKRFEPETDHLKAFPADIGRNQV